MNKKAILIAIIAIIIFAIGAGVWRWEKVKKNEEIKRVEEQKITEQKNQEEQKQKDDQTGIDTSDWKTYRNEEYGFEFKYPLEWSISEKILKNKDLQKNPVSLDYIAKNYQSGDLNRIDFYSIIVNAPFGYISFVPFTFVVDKNIEFIRCDYDSVEPCFNKKGFNLEKTEIEEKEAYIKKYADNSFSIFLKNLPKNWGNFNEINFINQEFGNLSQKDNINIDNIFQEVLRSIHFF